MKGLLRLLNFYTIKNLPFPAIFVGERKGNLAVIISNDTCSKMDSEQQGIFNANNDDVNQYLSTISMS